MMRILIVGAGGHARVIAECLWRMREAGSVGSPIGFVDDNPDVHGNCYLQLPVLGSLAAITAIPHERLIVGIGNNQIRQQIYTKLHNEGHDFARAIHPRAVVAPDVVIGPGTVIFAGAVVNTGALVGENVIINTGATVDHDNYIGNHVHIAPGVHLGGDVTIGAGTLVGIGAIVMSQQQVGAKAIVGAGAVVHRAVADRTTVIGIPAKASCQAY